MTLTLYFLTYKKNDKVADVNISISNAHSSVALKEGQNSTKFIVLKSNVMRYFIVGSIVDRNYYKKFNTY